MREAAMRNSLRGRVIDAMVRRARWAYEAKMDEAYEAQEAAGGDEDSLVSPFEFDQWAAEELGMQLADRAASDDRDDQAAAYEEIGKLGVAPLDLMSGANLDHRSPMKDWIVAY